MQQAWEKAEDALALRGKEEFMEGSISILRPILCHVFDITLTHGRLYCTPCAPLTCVIQETPEAHLDTMCPTSLGAVVPGRAYDWAHTCGPMRLSEPCGTAPNYGMGPLRVLLRLHRKADPIKAGSASTLGGRGGTGTGWGQGRAQR